MRSPQQIDSAKMQLVIQQKPLQYFSRSLTAEYEYNGKRQLYISNDHPFTKLHIPNFLRHGNFSKDAQGNEHLQRSSQ